jgi:hypothetical protein
MLSTGTFVCLFRETFKFLALLFETRRLTTTIITTSTAATAAANNNNNNSTHTHILVYIY